VFQFFRLMIAFRKAHPSLARSRFWRDDVRVWAESPTSHTLAQPRVRSPQRVATGQRSLRHDQRVLGRSLFPGPGGNECRMAARGRHQPGGPARFSGGRRREPAAVAASPGRGAIGRGTPRGRSA
jgi:hypothetical protein